MLKNIMEFPGTTFKVFVKRVLEARQESESNV